MHCKILWTVAEAQGAWLWFVAEVRKGEGEQMSKSEFILVKYMYIPSMI